MTTQTLQRTQELYSPNDTQFTEQGGEAQLYTPHDLVTAVAELGPHLVPESLALLDAATDVAEQITERDGKLYAGDEEIDESVAKRAVVNSKRETWAFSHQDERISSQIAKATRPSDLKGPAGIDYKRFERTMAEEPALGDEETVLDRYKASWARRRVLNEEIKSAADREDKITIPTHNEPKGPTAVEESQILSIENEPQNDGDQHLSPKEKRIYHRRDNLKDLLGDEEGNGGAYIDTAGRVRYGGKAKTTKGRKLMSKKELDLIEDHASTIRDGLVDRREPGAARADKGETANASKKDAIAEAANKLALPGLSITNTELDKAMLALGYKNAHSAVEGVSSTQALEHLGETIDSGDETAVEKRKVLLKRIGGIVGKIAVNVTVSGARKRITSATKYIQGVAEDAKAAWAQARAEEAARRVQPTQEDEEDEDK